MTNSCCKPEVDRDDSPDDGEREREVEIPVGDYARVFLRPKEVMSKLQVRDILKYISACFKAVRETEKSVIVFIPDSVEVIVVKPTGEVKVY